MKRLKKTKVISVKKKREQLIIVLYRWPMEH